MSAAQRMSAKYDELEAEQEVDPTDYREGQMEGIAWSITQVPWAPGDDDAIGARRRLIDNRAGNVLMALIRNAREGQGLPDDDLDHVEALVKQLGGWEDDR